MIITIDGPAGVGKTSISKALAEKRGFFLLPSGLVYRALAYACLERGWLSPEGKLLAVAFEWLYNCSLNFSGDEVLVDGVDVASLLYSTAVEQVVSEFSSYLQVRMLINQRLQSLGSSYPNLIAEGRDMGTVVFPNAELKVYLDAKLAIRVQRCELSRGQIPDVMARMQERDKIDYNKEYGKLQLASGAHYFDVSNLTFRQVYDKLIALLERATVST